MTHAHAARSAVIPCQVTNPSAANGAAPSTQIQESVSSPSQGDRPKYSPTAAAHARTANAHCRSERPKNTPSV